MPQWLAVILEIIKITVPALIVYLTVHTLLKQYLNKQYQFEALQTRSKQQDSTLPLKLQAYERLSLFCERIHLPTLLFRISDEGMSARQLRMTLLMAIQQEFEHNITQQVYVSDQLWQIIKAARDDVVAMVSLAMDSLPEEASSKDLASTLLQIIERRGATGLDTALLAIKKEAGVILNG